MRLPMNWAVVDGVPWYRAPGATWRARGVWRTCQTCGEEFASLPTNPGHYCSKSCVGRRPGNSRSAIRPDLFEHWTPEECWLAGIIWTDGTFDNREQGPRLMLGMTDEDAVAAAAQVIGCAYRSRQRPEPRKTIHLLQIGERNAVRRMASIGMGEPKHISRPFPTLPHPDAFLRGAFDGDGCVSTHTHRYKKYGRQYESVTPVLRSQLCGGIPFLEGAQEFLTTQGITPKTIHKHGSIHAVEWSTTDTLRLQEIMYADGGPCIQRKRAIFEEARLTRSTYIYAGL